MNNIIGIIVGLIGLILAWHLFYRVVKAKTIIGLKIKVTLVVIIFSSLIFQFSNDIYAFISKTVFSFNKQGTVQIQMSPFRIPDNNQNMNYCNQFTDKKGNVITAISARADGRYCGNFWRFKTEDNIILPYKQFDNNHYIYWTAANLQMIAPIK